MHTLKSIHFTGVKGVGMAPLAVIAKEAGLQVTGSDVADTYITDEILQKARIHPEEGFCEEHVGNVDLLITTGAHGGFTNPEVIAAKAKGIRIMTQGEAVGYFMSGEPFARYDMKGISVAGCHGKTTTVAMIATLLKSAKKDPSFVIGTGFIPSLGSSGHFGKGEYFVAEADEYATEPVHDKTPKFLWQHPRIAVVTNIEYDHPDLYPTFASLIAAYKQFILQVIEDEGTVVACGDDPEIQKIVQYGKKHVITYGFNSNNEYVLSNLEDTLGGIVFQLARNGEVVGQFTLSVPGEFNALNGSAAIIAGLRENLSIQEIQQGLLSFAGTKRRLEFVGNTKSGASVFDDYAHHPTEIKKTLAALRKRYKDSRIVCVFQPHTFSRTKLLYDAFSSAFSDASLVILCDIYASQREPFDNSVSSKQLAGDIAKKQHALYLPKLSDVVQYFEKNESGPHTIIITMGAGDVYQIAYQLIENVNSK